MINWNMKTTTPILKFIREINNNNLFIFGLTILGTNLNKVYGMSL